MLRTFAIAIVAALTLGGAWAQQPAPHAQPPEPLKYIPAGDIAARLAKPQPDMRATYTIVTDHENYWAEYVTRTGVGDPEQHDHWLDSIHVISGDGAITYGGTFAGATENAPGEPRGGKIVGGTTITVHSGDYLEIPAGVPHQMTSVSAKFTFVVFKSRQ
jgi:mannose-6-phosphate isomerase-like protein (cupin superfamily)